MEQHRIKTLIDLVQASDLTELTLSEGGTTLTLSRLASTAPLCPPVSPATQTVPPPEAAATPPAQSPTASRDVPSPLYGILHLTPAPGEPAFVDVGQRVEAGTVLCIVEAMKMFHQVQAPCAGVIEALLASGGNEVDAGQPLIRMGA